jgi:dolichyl-phosphate beta-glucosyltransferase
MQRFTHLFLFIFLGIAALFITEILFLVPSLPLLWGFEIFLVGIVFRTLRRFAYFHKGISFEQALSFEFLFQGFSLLNPQIPYPFVEMNFLKRHIPHIAPQKLLAWFSIRNATAVVIPCTLAASFTFASEDFLLFVLFVILTVAFALRSGNPLSVLFGVIAALLEMILFAQMTPSIFPNSIAFAMYGGTLLIFELAPIPLSIGLLEIAFGLFIYIFDMPLSTLVAPLCYRFFRAIPILIGTFFYMPRYKLSLSDLYNSSLPSLLLEQWKPEKAETASKYLSIVIPAYNEEKRLPAFLPGVLSLSRELGNSEVIVYDDGSQDKTSDYVRSLMQEHPSLSLISDEHNQGKGAGLKTGVLAAQGQYVLFADADGSIPIEEAKKLLPHIETGTDIVIGVRASSPDTLGKSSLRTLMSWVFYRLTDLLVTPGISDTQCGFKLFRRPAAHKLFSLAREKGWAIDVEILYLAQKFGMHITEIPIHWHAVEGSKIHPLRDSWRMFCALFRIRSRWSGLSS